LAVIHLWIIEIIKQPIFVSALTFNANNKADQSTQRTIKSDNKVE